MRKILYTFLAAATVLLSGCNKNETTENPEGQTRFILTTQEPATRATTITPTRYVMEVYAEDGTTPENVFPDGTNHATSNSGAFTATLDNTKAYTCLFWADDAATYNPDNLKAVALNADKEVTECYFAKIVTEKGKNPTVTIAMKRAVAKITMHETGGVVVGEKIVATYNQYPTFNVFSGSATGTAASVSTTRTVLDAKTTGVIGELLMLANTEKELINFSFVYNGEPAKNVSNIPMQQNFVTNIKGEYSSPINKSFIVTANDTWSTPNYEGGMSSKKTITINGVDFKFVLVKAGTFQMGSLGQEIGRDMTEVQHWVRITKDFYMGETEVTQAQWRAVMGNNPSFYKTPIAPDLTTDNYPVEQVSWLNICSGQTIYNSNVVSVKKEDCFLTKINALTNCEFNLPTEAQWEYAARGGHKNTMYMQYPGTTWDYDGCAWHGGNSQTKTHGVASKAPNLLGIYDMAGNVSELCLDFYSDYSTTGTETLPLKDPVGTLEGGFYIARGGHAGSYNQDCRSAARRKNTTYGVFSASYSTGFRLILVPSM